MALDLASAACTARFAATLAGVSSSVSSSSADSAPLSSAEASAVHPASETWVLSRSSFLSFFSPPVGGGRRAVAAGWRAEEAF